MKCVLRSLRPSDSSISWAFLTGNKNTPSKGGGAFHTINLATTKRSVLSQLQILTYKSNLRCLRICLTSGGHKGRGPPGCSLKTCLPEASSYPNSCQVRHKSSPDSLRLFSGLMTTCHPGFDFMLLFKT